MGRREGKKDAGGSHMEGGADAAKERVKDVQEEMPRGIRKVPPKKFPPTRRVGDESVQVKVPPQRKQPHLVKHAL